MIIKIMFYLGYIFSFFSPIGMYFFGKRTIKYTFLTCYLWFIGDIFFMIYNFLIKEYPLSIFFFFNNIMTYRVYRKTKYESKITNINKSNL